MRNKVIGLLGIFACATFFGQVNVESQVDITPTRSSFLDASGYTESEISVGKGLNFPRTDLTQFSFNTSDLGQYQYSKTAFDGMVVYNTGKGKTGTTAVTQGIQVDVVPGFYYFSNPTANEGTSDVSQGRWLPLGGLNSAVGIGTTETATDVIVDTKQVYAVKGSFTSNGSTKATIEFPTGIKSIYSIRVYKKDGVQGTKIVHSQLYSYDLAAKTDNVVFGSGVMSTSIPEGQYEYVLEYLK